MSDFLKNLQQKLDIFSEDEMRLLQDGGISVSETEQLDSESIGEPYDFSADRFKQDPSS